MKNKTYSLSEQTLEEIEEIKEKTAQNGTNLDASTIVRLALSKGLPIIMEQFALETSPSVNRTETSFV